MCDAMTMTRLPTILLVLTTVFSAQAEVYRWKDAQGNAVFSDIPHQGAEIIELGPTTIIPGQAEQHDQATTDTPLVAEASNPYESIAVVAPGQDETLRDQQAVGVDVMTVPDLLVSVGHRLQLYMDGAPLGAPSKTSHFVLPGVDRGTHQLAAAVLDKGGVELIRSTATVFHLHKTSVVDAKTGKPRPPQAK